MADVFISYNSNDYDIACKVRDALEQGGIESWFAPKDIAGGAHFTFEIPEQLARSRCVVLILSEYAMHSNWVCNEVAYAIDKGLFLLPVRVDHRKLTPEFDFLLKRTQIFDGYGLKPMVLHRIVTEVGEKLDSRKQTVKSELLRYTENEIGIEMISGGDPYYEEGITLFAKKTNNTFLLAPPPGLDDEELAWAKEKKFVSEDNVFGESLKEYTGLIPIADLYERIEASRRKIFMDFRKERNGCYFNNLKYGVERITPFARTADDAERPNMTILLYCTDYFTHRVIKDVCKQLVREKNEYILNIDYKHIDADKLFFTSLGINLLLLEDPITPNAGMLITNRSSNAAESYGKAPYSLSVIEGVSIIDYDTFMQKVLIKTAAVRGLAEELGVMPEMIKIDTLEFREFFVNRSNLEFGIWGTVELKRNLTIGNVIELHGKDEKLEIADKRHVAKEDLETFVRDKKEDILPQAMYVLCAYLESQGRLIIDHRKRSFLKKETLVCAKDGTEGPCGDSIVDTENFLAVIDGAMPKGERLWDGRKGDVFVSDLLGRTIAALEPDIGRKDAVNKLNDAIRKAYISHGVKFHELPPEERLQASVLIYSKQKKEIWSFGDCILRINQKSYLNIKKGDRMLADLREFCIEAAALQKTDTTQGDTDYGREEIMPYLKKFTMFANSDLSFGYDVLDGGDIHTDHVRVFYVRPGDRVVMATDGYPELFDTLEETENHLKDAVKKDPSCTGLLRGTKGIWKGDQSYDDRAYVAFTVEE